MKKNPASPVEASSAASEENSDIEFDAHLVPDMTALKLQKEQTLNADYARLLFNFPELTKVIQR